MLAALYSKATPGRLNVFYIFIGGCLSPEPSDALPTVVPSDKYQQVIGKIPTDIVHQYLTKLQSDSYKTANIAVWLQMFVATTAPGELESSHSGQIREIPKGKI